ncbi:uncharacterized protein LOC126812122 isoform X2 [Patella vulgata]|uniref:uncharacterized protein LOC126812122 isoform X2 n=1 Tax=Patella vulgata TaxID=6465 RepID=UPI0021808226|nr:uncharacterized protein LOC126812122 isoform X2 [Patella vulgata]
MFGIQYRNLLMISLLVDTSCSGSRTIPIQTVSVNGTAHIHWSMKSTNIHFIVIKHNNNTVNIAHGRPDKLIIPDDRLSIIIRDSKITLTITKVRYDDAGIYTCLINIAQETKDVQLIVSALEKGSAVDVPGTVPSTSIRMNDKTYTPWPGDEALEKGSTVDITGTVPSSSIPLDDKTDTLWPGDEGSGRVELIVMVVIGLMVLFFILLAANTLYFRRKLIRGERVDSIGMVAHSYESINSSVHGRVENSATHNADDTSTVVMGQELSLNSNVIINTDVLTSNLSLPDDQVATPISHDSDGVNELNDISTVMTGPDHLTSALEILLTGNTRSAARTVSSAHASNEHGEECASCRNNYDRLQMRPPNVDNNTYTSLKDQTTEL